MKEMYIMKVDGRWGAYIPDIEKIENSNKEERFVDYVLRIMKKYPHRRLRCVINDGLEEKIRKSRVVIIKKQNEGR